MGTQLTMTNRLYEKEVMTKAFLGDLEQVLKDIEYLQKIIESNHQVYVHAQDLYKKVGQIVADSKFYLLSGMFILKKSLEEHKSLRLKEHMLENRPPELHNITPRPIGLLYDQIDSSLTNAKRTSYGFMRYTDDKFKEYYGDFLGELSKSLKYLRKNAF